MISLYLTFTARPLLIINDSGLNDSTAPHIIISMNSLCQDVEYTITVQIGVRESDNMSCMIQQNVTIMNRGRVDVDFTLNGGQEYCYTAVLSDVAGNTTPTTRTCVSAVLCVCMYLYYGTNNNNYT